MSPRNRGDVDLFKLSNNASVSLSRNLIKGKDENGADGTHKKVNRGALVNLPSGRMIFKEVHFGENVYMRKFQLHHRGQCAQHSRKELGSCMREKELVRFPVGGGKWIWGASLSSTNCESIRYTAHML